MNKKELIELCKKGDKQALSWLYQAYADKMTKICLHYVTDKQIAQDLLHDGFIIIFASTFSRKAGTLDGNDNEKYIFKIHKTAQFDGHNFFRRNRRK